MIEAVNASISVDPSVRAVAQQMTTAASFKSDAPQIQISDVGTNYSSKYVRLAPDTKPIFIVRDTNTGESIRQYPTESQLRAYQRAQQSQMAAAQNAEFRAEVQGTTKEDVAIFAQSSVEFKQVRQEVKKVDTPPPPLPGQTSVEFNPDGDTGADIEVKRFTTEA